MIEKLFIFIAIATSIIASGLIWNGTLDEREAGLATISIVMNFILIGVVLYKWSVEEAKTYRLKSSADETEEAIEDARMGNVESFSSIADLMNDLDSKKGY
ncbi:hypothetical protein [Mariprofundus sp. KV]|uniref:hypothetical protein n=1 Tax=Mariprofundus sp. KV TaxID=2608715 RepID=UPI0015A22B53|nr:hypothetical protein [Mariprofundus sp. KV]NWF36173.1 hypothetical protein [Mariprofundus sp. KV]